MALPLSAQVAAVLASAQARVAEGESLPSPPNNLPALKSIFGSSPLDQALVLGYEVRAQDVRDCIAPDGSIAKPGTPGFREAQEGRLGLAPMPKGWVFETRKAHKLYAIVDGNPILLERQANALGYARALAVGPNALDLGEIEIDQ